MRRPREEEVGPVAQHGTWRKMCTSSKNEDKTTFDSPVEKMPIFISKSPEVRMFGNDSGASTHMLNKRDLSPAEMGTLRREPTGVVVPRSRPATTKRLGDTYIS